MAGLLRDEDWSVLLHRIKDGKCTPFLGAGAAYGFLPLGADISRMWAARYEYPMEDPSNLISVAQFLALKYSDSVFPKDLIVEMFKEVKAPNFKDESEPHRILASLPLPVYVTTNYDDFMAQALRYYNRQPRRVLCQWNKAVKDYTSDNPTVFDKDPDFKPSVANPVVFHLHGYVPVAESLVLTEDDYMDFLVNIVSEEKLIPRLIARSLTNASLLFIGYRLVDWNFRVLLKSLARFMESAVSRLNVAVMLPPGGKESSPEKVQEYLTKYYQNIDVRVYWGSARDFVEELKQRWKQSGYAN